jgi:hypothetical protein
MTRGAAATVAVFGAVALSSAAALESAEADSPAVLVGAGDVASCREITGAEATAKLLDAIPGTVFIPGDLACPDGTPEEFANCFEPTWGRHKARTRPSTGNHDYHTKGAAPYFAYWGDAAGDPSKGYYSYELGTWHVVVLNSNCAEIGGCDIGSPQERWLRADLAAHPSACTVAYWHHPLFSSGAKASHARHPEVRPLWQALYDAGAELVLNGHEHNYERFAAQDPNGEPDPEHGIRQIVAGTGGRNLDPLPDPQPNSEVREDSTFGVLKVTLKAKGYDWEFVPVAGKSFTDSGSGTCHDAPPPSSSVVPLD